MVNKTTPKPAIQLPASREVKDPAVPAIDYDRSSDNDPAPPRHTQHVRKGVHYKRVHAARHSRMHTNQAPATNRRWPPSRQEANADRPPRRWAFVIAGRAAGQTPHGPRVS